MELTPLIQILMAIGAGVGSYAAIRYDLGKLHEKAQNAQATAAKAHERIDGIMQARL